LGVELGGHDRLEFPSRSAFEASDESHLNIVPSPFLQRLQESERSIPITNNGNRPLSYSDKGLKASPPAKEPKTAFLVHTDRRELRSSTANSVVDLQLLWVELSEDGTPVVEKIRLLAVHADAIDLDVFEGFVG